MVSKKHSLPQKLNSSFPSKFEGMKVNRMEFNEIFIEMPIYILRV